MSGENNVLSITINTISFCCVRHDLRFLNTNEFVRPVVAKWISITKS